MDENTNSNEKPKTVETNQNELEAYKSQTNVEELLKKT